MKSRFFNFLILFSVSSLGLTSASAATSPSEGQGIAYYRAGFPVVAKPLLIAEIETDSASRPETCFNLGNIYFADNQLDSAGYAFQKGLAANPFNSLNAIGLTMLKIKSNPTVADEEFKNILKLKQNKKNVDVLIAIANAYLFNGVLDNAVLYQEKAKEIKAKYAPVYVLLGDIEVAKKNVGEACKNYEQAIYFDDKCKEAFIKYARAYRTVNPTLAIEKLNALKAKEPSFLLVDRELADIYYATNDFSKAAELYDNYLKSGNSNIQDFTKYAFTLFLNGQFAKSLEVTNMGLLKSPRNPVFNRLAMYNNVELKQNAASLTAADNFFHKTDKPEFTFLDFRYFGQAYRNVDSLNLAIPQYETALKYDSTKFDLWKDISDMYVKKSNYGKAIAAYSNYYNSLGSDKITSDVNMQYGRLFYGRGTTVDSTLTAADKKNALLKADSIFGRVSVVEPTSYRSFFWRARTSAAINTSETTMGLAKPYYDNTVAILEAKADPRYNPILIECYSYLGYYFYLQKDFNTSIETLKKVLVLDPANVKAKTSIDEITKEVNKKKK